MKGTRVDGNYMLFIIEYRHHKSQVVISSLTSVFLYIYERSMWGAYTRNKQISFI